MVWLGKIPPSATAGNFLLDQGVPQFPWMLHPPKISHPKLFHLFFSRFSSVFPSLNMAVKRREQTLQDYKRLQSKVEKYEEKERTGPVLAKLHQAREELRPVKEDFEAKNKQLLEEMPKFYSSRIDYFKPSFESLVRAQVVYYTEMHKIFGDLTAQIDRPGLSDEQRERENDAKLSELRALSIVADD
uniref:Bridging integrator 3 n=11 Tax=Neoaves TaxID=3078114 RepID=A0A8C5ILG1_JUNHY